MRFTPLCRMRARYSRASSLNQITYDRTRTVAKRCLRLTLDSLSELPAAIAGRQGELPLLYG